MGITTVLMNDLAEGRERQKDKIWLGLPDMEVNEKVELNSPAGQAVLNIKIEGLKYELAMVKELRIMKVE